MTNVDSQRIKEIRDNTRAMADAFSCIANTLAEALELYVSTQTKTQNSNSTFEKDNSKDITTFSIYGTVSPKFTEEQIKTDETKRIHDYGIPKQSYKLTVDELGIVKFSEKGASDE